MSEPTAVASTPDVDALAEQVRRVAELRRNVAALVETLDEHRRTFDLNTADLRGLLDAAKAERDAAEDVVRALALTRYLATHDKAPAVGVVVKEYDSLQYDADEAFRWAREKQMALVPEQLDRKAFEKIAKATSIGFVYVIVEPRVQIASDLEKVLGGAQ